jgi:hypothetical protein
MKRILTATIVILSLCVSSAIVIAEPVVEDVTISPEEPKVKDTVTITATITSDEDIEEVTLRIKECDENMCMQTKSYPMEFEDGKYTYTDELTYAAATYFGYQFIILSNGNETETEFVNVTLKPADNGETNGGNGGNGDGGIPGFELVPPLVAIIIGVLLLRRKRSR